ncbi:hypothetical protein EDC04DRAFT_1245493 [Pisolithus marmoratus]|nr:hypothetical protein EDC04DRAFT_1245493 [Pisolithus marmoratus]
MRLRCIALMRDSIVISNPAMDELTQARAALAALEKREQELLDELCSIRDAALLQRSRINELVAQMPIASVNRLPVELLLRTFQIYLETIPESCYDYFHSKRGLASVSRRWRDVILHSPSLWTTISVASYWSEARVKAYVARSSQSPLDIEFQCWLGSEGTLAAILNVLISCVHRWRSLTIQRDVTYLHWSLVLEKLNHLSFPSLKRVAICNFPGSLPGQVELHHPIFMHPESSPHLEHIHLHVKVERSMPPHIPSGVSALSLAFHVSHPIWHPSLFESPSCRGLTSLHITDHSDNVICNLLPDSIQLPLLEEFSCKLSCARTLIHALVAPRLKRFDYSPPWWRNSPSAVFAGLHSRFSSVDNLRLSEFTAENLSEAVGLAFPNVCHLELARANRNTFYSPLTETPNNVLYWNNLKSLTLHGLYNYDLRFLDDLVTFLRQRLSAGQSKLQVKIIFWLAGTSSLFRELPEHCYLELWDESKKVL